MPERWPGARGGRGGDGDGAGGCKMDAGNAGELREGGG